MERGWAPGAGDEEHAQLRGAEGLTMFFIVKSTSPLHNLALTMKIYLVYRVDHLKGVWENRHNQNKR
ncbi:hypothetical protein J2Z66_004714 [Paenibacillus eucommiae]|uniref:Uncharacterized protein n=1 Tax=Paenibacillus eucommiae TaxID=1355755 RepID=A0ABS4IZS6_9BACL|nr:hypothetical protein [Paenibacillus eucommiae]